MQGDGASASGSGWSRASCRAGRCPSSPGSAASAPASRRCGPSLAPVTPRALSLTLKQMLAADLVDRALEDEFPPTAIYGLTGRGARLAAAMR